MPDQKNALEIGKLYLARDLYRGKPRKFTLYIPTKMTYQKREPTYDAPAFGGSMQPSGHPWTEFYEYKGILKYDDFEKSPKIDYTGTMRNQDVISDSVLAEDFAGLVFDYIFTYLPS